MFMYKCNGVLMSSQSLLYVSKSVCVPVYCLCVVCVLVCTCVLCVCNYCLYVRVCCVCCVCVHTIFGV